MSKSFPWQPTANTPRDAIACVNFGGDLHLYAMGFRDSAKALLEIVEETGHSQDLLVYPIVYSLRHTVELMLKQVVRADRRLTDSPGDFPDGHRLSNLWNVCRPVFERLWPSDFTIARVEATIMDLAELDPEGEAFRYPVTTKRRGTRLRTLDADLRHLDLRAMVEDVLEVIDVLDGADTAIDVYLDAKNDMLAEYRQIESEMRAEFEDDIRAEMASYYVADAREELL